MKIVSSLPPKDDVKREGHVPCQPQVGRSQTREEGQYRLVTKENKIRVTGGRGDEKEKESARVRSGAKFPEILSVFNGRKYPPNEKKKRIIEFVSDDNVA